MVSAMSSFDVFLPLPQMVGRRVWWEFEALIFFSRLMSQKKTSTKSEGHKHPPAGSLTIYDKGKKASKLLITDTINTSQKDKSYASFPFLWWLLALSLPHPVLGSSLDNEVPDLAFQTSSSTRLFFLANFLSPQRKSASVSGSICPLLRTLVVGVFFHSQEERSS